MVEIKRYPTRLGVRCGDCGREATVTVFLDQTSRLRCSKCGSRQVIIASRDRMSGWARRRRGAGATKNWRQG
jgi:DNA-directed RNA polymerase subunit RPC12/RpoP